VSASAIGRPFGPQGRASYNEELLGKVRDWPLLSRILRLLGPHSAAVVASLFCSLASTLLQILNPLIISVAIDVYFLRHRPAAGLLAHWLPIGAGRGIALLSLCYLSVLALTLALDASQNFLAQWTGQLAMADLRRQLLEHLHKLPIGYYDVTPAGRLVTRLTTDVEALNDLFANGIVALLANAVMTVFFLAAMFRVNPHLTLVLAGVIPIFLSLSALFRQLITKSQQRVRILLARINAFIAEHVNGIYVVHLFNRQVPSLDMFDEINREHMKASKDWVTANAWFMPSVELLGTVSQAGLLVVGAYLLRGGHLTIGTLVAFLQYGSRFLRPIQEISERYGTLQTSVVSAEKVFALLDTEALPEEQAPGAVALQGAAVEFDHVWFAYKPGRWVLHDVNFQIPEGETLAIVGHTGAGKTTLSNLLLRFYRPQRGAIRLGGVDIAEMHSSDLRRRFGVVLQDTYVREGTILDNIRFGSDALSDADALRAAREIGLEAMMQRLPDGLETWVHERGDNLSTGQKQMIAFARALAHDPLYLMLDEATANIDLETEARIRAATARLLEGRTSIVIAHRLSTVLTADRILVMHKGKVAEEGSHQELLALRGLYWRLFQIQFGFQNRGDDRAEAASANGKLKETYNRTGEHRGNRCAFDDEGNCAERTN
jgi:ATP-binding cassette, subfamily B, multidrug efflux pump